MKVIILAGGSGTRLWPLSRDYYPKQFLKLEQLNNYSLFQLTFQRAMKIVSIEDILVVTSEKHKFLVMGVIEELGINFDENNILTEPIAKNTLPAISYAMSKLSLNESALILPSDHYIKNDDILIQSLEIAENLSKDSLVTFGIKPDSPHTGYGYIKYLNYKVENFKEKPDLERAKKYLEEGYLWNSGMFYFNKEFFDKELEKADEETYSLFLSNNTIEEIFQKVKSDSIDFALLEKSKNISVIPLDLEWTDLGSFDSIYSCFEKDENLNHSSGNNLFENSKNNLVFSNDEKLISLYGISDCIVIDTKDALMICKREESENIKKIVSKLKSEKNEIVDFHKTVYRPWGYFTILEEKETHKVKRLTVLPGKMLSLQRHKFRAEHWTIVKGKAFVVNGENSFTLETNQSTYIPQNTLHRLGNKNNEILEIIETQSGEYLGEDDIERFDDLYSRK